MHIIVCVKQVPDTTEVKLDPVTNTLDRASAPAIINPYDAHGVEEAVRIKKKFGGKVTVISMGPPQAQDVIRKCIDMGADDGYLLTDRVFAGSDTLATSYIIAMGIRKVTENEPVDLILCGKQEIDGDTAQVGPGIASRLRFPQLTYVNRIVDIDIEKRKIIVHRRIDTGYEVVQSDLPCLVTVEKSINELSYATLPDKIRAARYTPVMYSVADFEADLAQMGLKGSPTTVSRVFPPPERAGGEVLKGDVPTVVAELVEKIRQKSIILKK